MSYLPISVQWKATHKTTPKQNKPKLDTIVNIEHGLKSYA